jgi:hypothetical protein
VHVRAASRKPAGDLILRDVAKEDASIIISDLKELDIPAQGSIAVEHETRHAFSDFISRPDFLSFFVAFVAGSAGVLSLTAAKSGALVGVLVSVATIPAAANVGVTAAYGEWGDAGGAAAQLGMNLSGIVAAGVLTLFVQRRYYVTRRRRHLMDPSRTEAGLPLGRSLRGTTEVPGWEDLQKRP